MTIFILSVRLSFRANEDRRIIYPPTLHVLNTEVIRGTGFCPSVDKCLGLRPLIAARLCAIECSMFAVLCLVSTRPPFDFADRCIAFILVSMRMKERMSFLKSRFTFRC